MAGLPAAKGRVMHGMALLVALGTGACGSDGSDKEIDRGSQLPGDGGVGDAGGDAGSSTLGPVSTDGLVVAIKAGKVKGKLVGSTR